MQTVSKASAGRVADTYDFVLSTEDVDRHGDIVVQNGLDLTQFKKNPIALFQHDHASPIGVWKNLRKQGSATVGTFVPAAKGTSRAVDLALSLLEQGILKATSISFVGKEKVYLEPRGIKYLTSELLEVSLVTVGANANALMVAKSIGMTDEEIKTYFTLPVGDLGDDGQRVIQKSERDAIHKKALEAIFRAKQTINTVRN